MSEPGEKQKDSLRISTQRQGPWENTVFQRLYVWLNYKEKGSIELKLFVSMTTWVIYKKCENKINTIDIGDLLFCVTKYMILE